MIDFEKWENSIDIAGLNEDAENATDYAEVPDGSYEVSIEQMELKESKNGDPMVSIWFNILEGKYKNSKIFYNQVINNGFGLHKANKMLRDLSDEKINVKLESFKQYSDLIEEIKGFGYEYALDYKTNKKGYKEYEITDVFEA